MYNENREKYVNTLEEVLNQPQDQLVSIQRGRGMSRWHFYRWSALWVFSLSFGLPSTLSSDAHFQEGAYYEFDQKSEHSAEEQGNDPTEAPPQPYFEDQIQKRLELEEQVPEKRNFFNNKIPRNQIPQNQLPRGTRERNQIERSPIPKNTIQPSPMPRNQIPRQSLERKRIERSPMPRKGIPRNPIPRNQIPREVDR